jgi:signal transduction histidine kinase/ligand-binding sensor domain-containing protein
VSKFRITDSFYLIILVVLLLPACKQGGGEPKMNAFYHNDTIEAPVVVEAGKPEIHQLDSLPEPKVTQLSSKPAPVIRPAGFFVNMPNFNTEHGLALSSILAGFKDKAGNLWFATSGNGVSKYDGQAFTNFTSNHGLIHNLVNCITEDQDGNIWFGTYGGISKYDGKGFQNFTMEQGLSDNDVNKIIEDQAGNLWFSSHNGVSKLNRIDIGNENIRFVSYNKKDGLPGGFVSDILEDSHGKIWFGTDYGISLFNATNEARGEKAFTNYPIGPEGAEVNTIVEDNNGFLWIGTDKGVLLIDPKLIGQDQDGEVLFTEDNGLINNDIKSSLIDREGNVWFGTNTGVSEYRMADSIFVNYTREQGLANDQVYSITLDDRGSLWFGTLGGGLNRYDGRSVIGFGNDEGLAGDHVLAITEDSIGKLWFCTGGGGIISYNTNENRDKRKIFVNYTSRQGFPDDYSFAMINDKADKLWFSADPGLSSFDGKMLVNYSTDQGLIDNGVVSLKEDSKGRLWIGTYEEGISVFDGKHFTNYTTAQGLVHNTAWCFYEDKKGNIWMATRGGLSLFDGKNFTNFTKAQGLTDNKLSYVTEDKNGNILIGSWGGGVSVIRENIVEQLTSGNAGQFNGAIFENFTTNEGLANDVVYSIIEDDDGNIFIGTSNGFTVLNGGIGLPGKNIARNGIEYFNQKTGYPIRDISNNFAMFQDSRGILWAGTGDKLVRFDYKSVIRNSDPPGVLINSVKVNNEHISWTTLLYTRESDSVKNGENYAVPAYLADELRVFDRKLGDRERDTLIERFSDIGFDDVQPFTGIPENLILPYKYNNLSFDFTGIETARPFLVQYQYLLEGYDEAWSPVSSKSTAHFGNISEGSYTLKVKACNPDGVWSEPVTYHFEILPPFYRSWMAYLFYALLLVAGIFAVDRFQRRRLIARERQRAIKLELMQAKEIEKAYTELKSTQTQLIQSEKMASLGELAAGIAHEIQNPLNFVNNFSEVSRELILEAQQELAIGNQQLAKDILKDVEDNLIKINHHGKRADSIIKGMLQHSRSSSGTKEPTDLNALADEYFRLAYHGLRAKDKSFNATMETDFDPNIGLANIIPQDIGRVILNLITNAFYAVNEKKKEADPKYKPTVRVQTIRTDSGVEVKVTDNGNGIPEKDLEKIFQPFFTTKPAGQGTGLGLSMSYDIIKAHGGTLTVNSTEKEGTIFKIILPNN